MPPPLPNRKQPPHTFADDLAEIEKRAWTPVRRAEDLARYLDEIYMLAAEARFSDYDINAVARAAPDIMYRLFDTRVHLRSRITDFERRGLMTTEVVQGLRDVFRVLRYVSDMLGEVATGHERRRGEDEPLRAFTGQKLNTLLNFDHYKAGDVKFRSGDVILFRGSQHNSAAIARIGDVDSQFSHVGIVYIDERGAHWLVESLIEDGAVISPLVAALEHNVVRAVLYRHKDEVLASRAARGIHDYIAKSLTASGARIPYDFTMRLDDNRDLFCSKLVRLAFSRGSSGEFVMPHYPTRLSMRNSDFLDRIGVKAKLTFAPGDIDLEPQFDLVAEWQDYRETSNIRLQDFTMDRLFAWMDTYDMRFEETPLIRLVARLGRFSAYFSERAKAALSSVFPRVPRNMRRRTIATIIMLHKTAEPIFGELRDLEHRSISTTGLPMHGIDVVAALERIRVREGNAIGYLKAGPNPQLGQVAGQHNGSPGYATQS